MPLSDLDGLLPALDQAFDEPISWAPGRVFRGRFIRDALNQPVPMTEMGISSSETWFYCDRKNVPPPGVPQIGDILMIRAENWEIVEAGEDDLGELQYRLIRAETPVSPRGPGRPSRREDIITVYEELIAEGLDQGRTLSQLFPLIRRRLTGSIAIAPGLGDKTLHQVLGPHRRAGPEPPPPLPPARPPQPRF